MEQLQIKTKNELISYLFSKNILLSPKIVSFIDNSINFNILKEFILEKESNLDLINEKDILSLFENNFIDNNSNNNNYDNASHNSNSSKSTQNEGTNSEVNFLSGESVNKYDNLSSSNTNVQVIYNYRDYIKKREVNDFRLYLNKRYKAIAEILMKRDLPALSSINKIYNNLTASDEISIIGIVYSIDKTKNGHYIIELEDPTGKSKVLINKNREDVCSLGKEIVLDEIIAVTGVAGKDIFFANKIYFPDIPVNKELKKSQDEVYVAFISDLQIGSNRFMHSDFRRFLMWMKGELGSSEQKRIGRKTKYLFVVGDLIDGVGVYPGQKEELEIVDIYEQYKKAAEYLSQVPEDVHIIIIPGNHDAVRISDPQPPILKRFAPDLYKMKNITLVSSPGIVRIHQSKKFPGFDVLMYHGFSIFYYADTVEKLRDAGGGDRADLVLKFLLQKRHLAPSHGSNLYIPDTRGDAMVIEKVPDILVCGHVHRANAIIYRGVSIISGSCWDGISEYSLKFGGNPSPGRVPVLDLKTRNVKMMKFVQDEE